MPYRGEGRDAILSLAAFADAKREITSWPGYQATPLRRAWDEQDVVDCARIYACTSLALVAR